MHKVIIDDILESSCTADTQYKTYFSIPPPCLAIGPSTSSQQKKNNNKNSALHSELHYVINNVSVFTIRSSLSPFSH